MNNRKTAIRFFTIADYGWEYIGRCVGWLYFRKPSSEIDSEQDGEFFYDNESRIDMINYVVKTRLLPILIIFLCCVLPNFFRSIETSDPLATVFTVFFAVMTLLYLYLPYLLWFEIAKTKEKI